MRRVNLNMKDQQTYEVIKSIVEHGGNKSRASLKLGCSKRSIDRYIAGYKSEGKEYFIHGNRGKQPKHTVDETTKLDVINLYLNKYPNANFAHYTELLEKRENIVVSENWIRTVMSKAEILSPKANRKTKKEAKKRLEKKLAQTKNAKKSNEIKMKIMDIEEAHPRRSRCSRFGEMIQMDASEYFWIDGEKCFQTNTRKLRNTIYVLHRPKDSI